MGINFSKNFFFFKKRTCSGCPPNTTSSHLKAQELCKQMVCLMLILQCETPIAHKHVWQCLEQLSVAISFVHVSFLQNPECVITKFQFQNVCISSESESLEWESNSWRQRCGSCQAEWIFGSGRVGEVASVPSWLVYSWLILKHFYTSGGCAINITMNPKELEHIGILTHYHLIGWT